MLVLSVHQVWRETTINPALHSSLIQCSPSSSFIMRCAFTLLAALAALILVQANPNIPGRSDDCPPNDIWRNGCDDFENICKISCAEGESCEYLGGSCGNHEDVEILDSLQCQKICEASRDNEEVSEVSRHCRFWRWVSKTWTITGAMHFKFSSQEKQDLGPLKMRYCSLMNGDQCDIYDYCRENTCQCGDVGCPGDQPPDQP